MALSPEQIEAEALALEEPSRAHIAKRLIQSLEPEKEAQIERLWLKEALRRQQELESGSAKPVPAEEAFARLLAKLA